MHFWRQTFSHYATILKNTQFMSYLIGGVMAYGVVIAYTTMSPFLFQKTLGYSATDYGWFTLLIAAAYYASTHTNRHLIHRFEPVQVMKIGLFLILLAGAILWMGAGVFHTMNIYSIMVPLMIATYGQAFIWSNTIALALKDLSKIAGTAAALFSCIQMILSAGVSAILAIFPEHNQKALATAIMTLGIISWLVFRKTVFKP